MASNFRIFVDRGFNRLHIRLNGDFDGTAAFELIHMLNKCTRQARKVIIDTSGLDRVFPFGRETFRKNLLYHTAGNAELVFRGRHGKNLLPRI